MGSRNKRKVTVPPPNKTRTKTVKLSSKQMFGKGINTLIEPRKSFVAVPQETKLREVIDMFRYHHPDVKIEVTTHTPGDYVEFYIEGVQRIQVAMTQMAIMPAKDIYYILEKAVKYRDLYANATTGMQEKMMREYQNGYNQILKPRQMGKSASLEEMKRLIEEANRKEPIGGWDKEAIEKVAFKDKSTNPTDDWANKWSREHGAKA